VESYDRLEVLFWTIFDQKSGQLQKIISRKQKIWHLQNFNHGFFIKAFSCKISKISKMTLILIFGLEH
jgi:hypothetical protein